MQLSVTYSKFSVYTETIVNSRLMTVISVSWRLW